MTSTKKDIENGRNSIVVVRLLYVLSVAVALYFIANGKLGDAISSLGVALVFDPFDPSVPWQQRPTYQKVLPIVHVTILLTMLVVMMW